MIIIIIKQVQQEILEQRVKDKKSTVQAVKNYSKGSEREREGERERERENVYYSFIH